MSRCGSCDLYWPNGKRNFGVVCQRNCSEEECAENLQDLIYQLRNELEKSNEKDLGNGKRT